MKYTILDFNQEKAIELGLTLDELVILQYFIDFKESGAMKYEIIDNKIFYWVNYNSFTKEIPILNISKDRLYRKFKSLADKQVLLHKTIKSKGTWSYYSTGPKYIELKSNSVKVPDGYGENNGEGTVKITKGYGKNNGTKINLLKDSSIKYKKYIVEIIDYLNKVCSTKYKSTTENTRKTIEARIKDGFAVDDFKLVIDKKFNDWHGTEYEQYLRPTTLFGNKFESYLNQPTKEGGKRSGSNGKSIKKNREPEGQSGPSEETLRLEEYARANGINLEEQKDFECDF